MTSERLQLTPCSYIPQADSTVAPLPLANVCPSGLNDTPLTGHALPSRVVCEISWAKVFRENTVKRINNVKVVFILKFLFGFNFQTLRILNFWFLQKNHSKYEGNEFCPNQGSHRYLARRVKPDLLIILIQSNITFSGNSNLGAQNGIVNRKLS